MKTDAFERYIRDVTCRIDDKGARKEAGQEIRAHLTDTYDEQIALGKTHDEAILILPYK